MYHIYTDGSTRNNGAVDAIGAWAFAIYDDDNKTCLWHKSSATKGTTNNREELKAMIAAIEQLLTMTEDFFNAVIYSDSAYIINCANQGWYKKWSSNGWLTSKKEPVLNQDLWSELIPYFDDARFKFQKVKGHANNENNNFVDSLAQKSSAELERKENVCGSN